MGRLLGAGRGRIGRVVALVGVVVAGGVIGWRWDDLFEKRVVVVAPGRVVRGAWQKAGPLRRIVGREKIRTIVSLTAINEDDPKYVEQARVVREAGLRWVVVPIKGSWATVEEIGRAADLLADPSLQPVFFHCVAGHHRSSQVQAAYRIRHEGWTAARAWAEVAGLGWARPEAEGDRRDRRLIEAFAAAESKETPRHEDDDRPGRALGIPGGLGLPAGPLAGRRLELPERELRRGDPG